MRSMVQRFARWLGGIALHWFYSDVQITGADRIPDRGPILIAMNHQNALVDAILAFWIVPRELRLTAKATLGDSVAGSFLMKIVGVIPLRRASDDPATSDPIRNRRSFEAMIQELHRGGAVLVFPEGRSHNDPEVAPLKTGLARAALRARESGVRGIRIVPVGITFENKAEPNTAVLAQVGEPIAMDEWRGSDARALTETIAGKLRAISLTGDVHSHVSWKRPVRNPLIRVAGWWGRTTHSLPLRVARHEAIRVSADEGEPAMYTMTFGLGAIIVSYLIEVPIVWLLFGWIAGIAFLASLIAGAYWAAYAEHSPERSRI
jgi:1-acyl-sn-glycerol-3-phosphate acyltransferase